VSGSEEPDGVPASGAADSGDGNGSGSGGSRGAGGGTSGEIEVDGAALPGGGPPSAADGESAVSDVDVGDGHVDVAGSFGGGQGSAADGGRGVGGDGTGADVAATGGGANAADLLSGTALTVFRLNGQFLEVAERLARPVGLTAAWWQVLGAVLYEPLPVSGIARVMGITRQSVQRIADLLVDQGLAGYLPNPAHRTAKLLSSTEEGRDAVRRIVPAHGEAAARLATELGPEEFATTLRVLTRLSEAVERIITESGSAPPTRPRAS
jgi:DNA-binding MarR family transcriptional regulator